MSEWKEVPAWEALKAYQEGTHDVQYTTSSTNSNWTSWSGYFVSGDAWRYRIRPKVRTVDVIGLPRPKIVFGPTHSTHANRVLLDYATEAEASRAYEALCAASK